MSPHGGDIYRNGADLDFSVSVNPLGMPRSAAEAAREAVRLCGNYPDPRAERLTEAAAGHECVPASFVLPGNGAAELIFALLFTLRPRTTLVIEPGFSEYRRAAEAAGSEVLTANLREEDGFVFPVEAFSEKWPSAELIFLCNPHNPTGLFVPRIRELIRGVYGQAREMCAGDEGRLRGWDPAGPWICVDECFLDFADDFEERSVRALLREYPKLIVLRALTKFYGMPGLRAGYLLSSNPELLGSVKGVLQPWNLSIPAQAAGAAAFADRDYAERTRKLIREEREYLTDRMLEGLADPVMGAGANFILFRARGDLQDRLLERRILIRSFADRFPKGPDGTAYFRIGVRTREENVRLIGTWRNLS